MEWPAFYVLVDLLSVLEIGQLGLPESEIGPVGHVVPKLALSGAGGVMVSAAMLILASSLSWCFFLFTKATTSLPSLLTAPSQCVIFWSKTPTCTKRLARCERREVKCLLSPCSKSLAPAIIFSVTGLCLKGLGPKLLAWGDNSEAALLGLLLALLGLQVRMTTLLGLV